ncbi:class I adenylate-forming enzyme family protein [Mesorhizobium sp. LHD-90]|uniref:class I adenylate-forming enzyme family protein n=1 Tax=Mesorhizobium sp. LHD-90 TaxID=3071414 RepID=UPI0027DFC5FE|nr:class I adenylate-forming enzyme family protein [Mesorhizobium sp. LHD-90]MDQ6438122.1 class I adenylate-forming enzyme family protein [Mesorhizobium sp. LHD-90]
MTHLSDPLSSSVARQPDATAFQFGDQRVSYGRFGRDVAAVASRLIAGGVQAGETVGVFIGQPAEHWCVLLALMRVGAVSVSLTSRHEAEIDALPGLTTIVFGGETPPACPRSVRLLSIAADWLDPDANPGVSLPSASQADAAAGRICFTSGSVGRPKAIYLDAGRLGIRLSKTAERSRLNARSVLWCGLGPDSAYGFTATLAAWREGGKIVFTRRSDDLKSALVAGGVNVVISSPSALHAILNSSSQARFEGPTIVAGSPISPALRDRLLRDLCSEVLVAYGSSETGGVTLADAVAIDGHPGAVGRPFSDVQVQVVDKGLPLPAGVPGQVRIRSRSQVPSYLDDPLSTAVHFVDGWFYPGDVGVITPAGGLNLLARESDILNVDGVKLSGSDIDAAVRQQPGVQDVAAVPIVDPSGRVRLAIALVASEEAARVLSGTIRAVMLGLPHFSLVQVSRIPRSSMGKVNRNEFGRLLSQALANRGSKENEVHIEADHSPG